MYSRTLLLLPLFLAIEACRPEAPVEQAMPESERGPLRGAWQFISGEIFPAIASGLMELTLEVDSTSQT